MSGSRQHTIPRFLLNGFASKTQGYDSFVWVYRKDSLGREINTLNVGVENHFYGKASEVSVDDQITAIEPLYADLLRNLQDHGGSRPVEDGRIPKFITHLSTRTRFLRQSITDSMALLLDGLHERFKNHDFLQAQFFKDSRVQNLLQSMLSARGVAPDQMDEAILLLKPYLPKLMDLLPELPDLVDRSMDVARAAMPNAIRAAHINALSRIPAEDKRAESYAKLNWFIVVVDTRLLLGDTVCVFETSGERWFKPVHEADDDLRKVLLPLSFDRLLLGSPVSVCPSLDVNVINKAIVRCSYEYFVSSEALPSHSALVRSIGRWSGITSESELRTISKNL
jgi:hypothetical protein